MSNQHVVHVTQDSFQKEVLESAEPVVIDFWAPWCGPCRMIAPVLDELADSYGGKVRVAKVNVDDEPGLAQAFQVRGIPTLYAVVGGEVTAQMVGFGGKKKLEALFAELAEGKAA